eukprot:2810054-Amphidinium_carterae.1
MTEGLVGLPLRLAAPLRQLLAWKATHWRPRRRIRPQAEVHPRRPRPETATLPKSPGQKECRSPSLWVSWPRALRPLASPRLYPGLPGPAILRNRGGAAQGAGWIGLSRPPTRQHTPPGAWTP